MPQLYVSEAVPSPAVHAAPPGAPGRRAPLSPPGPENTGDKRARCPPGAGRSGWPEISASPSPSSPGPGDSSHSGAPPSPACLIPSSSCRRRLRSGSSIPSGTGAPAFQSQVTPEQDRRGRPSPPHLPQLHPDAQQVRPLHGYLSLSALPARAGRPGLLPAGGQPQAGQAVGLPLPAQAAGPDQAPVVARHAAHSPPLPSNSGQARVSSSTGSPHRVRVFFSSRHRTAGASPICFSLFMPNRPHFFPYPMTGQKKRSLFLKSAGQALRVCPALFRRRPQSVREEAK